MVRRILHGRNENEFNPVGVCVCVCACLRPFGMAMPRSYTRQYWTAAADVRLAVQQVTSEAGVQPFDNKPFQHASTSPGVRWKGL